MNISDNHLKYFDEVENISSYEHAKRLNELELIKTQDKKRQFISKVKGELGKEILANPRSVKIIKVSFKDKCINLIKRIFSKF